MTEALFVSKILDGSSKSWGAEVTEGVPYGILPLDLETGGLDIMSGGVYNIYGNEGSRKTSLALNIIMNQCLSGKLPPGYTIAWDSLESGMPIQRVAHIMVSMIANKILTLRHWTGLRSEIDYHKLMAAFLNLTIKPHPLQMITEVGVTENGRFTRENTISPKIITRGLWTKNQKEAIGIAWGIVDNFPIIISGLSQDSQYKADEEKRDFVQSVYTLDVWKSYERWEKYALEYGVREVVVDHVNKYDVAGSDYEVQKESVRAFSKWIASGPGRTVWAMTQVGTAQRTIFRNEEYDLPSSKGGSVVAEEASGAWYLKYSKDTDMYWIKMLEKKLREGRVPPIYIPVEPTSGAVFGFMATTIKPPGISDKL